MNQILKFSFIILLIAIFSPACTVESIDDEMDDGVVISNQIAQGATDAGVPFTTAAALVENTALFGDDGFYFHLFAEDEACSSNFNGDVRFFIPSTTDLAVETYSGQGPFITSTSFFGCDVIITDVSDTEISGRVKGGDIDGDKWIEGAFVATLCN